MRGCCGGRDESRPRSVRRHRLEADAETIRTRVDGCTRALCASTNAPSPGALGCNGRRCGCRPLACGWRERAVYDDHPPPYSRGGLPCLVTRKGRDATTDTGLCDDDPRSARGVEQHDAFVSGHPAEGLSSAQGSSGNYSASLPSGGKYFLGIVHGFGYEAQDQRVSASARVAAVSTVPFAVAFTSVLVASGLAAVGFRLRARFEKLQGPSHRPAVSCTSNPRSRRADDLRKGSRTAQPKPPSTGHR